MDPVFLPEQLFLGAFLLGVAEGDDGMGDLGLWQAEQFCLGFYPVHLGQVPSHTLPMPRAWAARIIFWAAMEPSTTQ